MKYTVVNAPIADYQLAKIWVEAIDRQAVADAFDRMETSLKHEPRLQGREHPNGWRVITVPPHWQPHSKSARTTAW